MPRVNHPRSAATAGAEYVIPASSGALPSPRGQPFTVLQPQGEGEENGGKREDLQSRPAYSCKARYWFESPWRFHEGRRHKQKKLQIRQLLKSSGGGIYGITPSIIANWRLHANTRSGDSRLRKYRGNFKSILGDSGQFLPTTL